MKWYHDHSQKTRPKRYAIRVITRFIWFPKRYRNITYWCEFVVLYQQYMKPPFGWITRCIRENGKWENV